METDEDVRRTAPAEDPAPGTVSLERHSPAVAIVTLRGEHDLATRAEIKAALARTGGDADVLVDLSQSSFIDSSVIGALVAAFQEFAERGRRLELAIPRESAAIQRVVHVAGLRTFLTIHETRSAGLASISAT
jgi:anti-sigma B factor antagonist